MGFHYRLQGFKRGLRIDAEIFPTEELARERAKQLFIVHGISVAWIKQIDENVAPGDVQALPDASSSSEEIESP